ncbi:uncharacterized protein [Aristolochia californica]|uniref:uncharacterized protein n=1 Tax=Aristolochia californica TaxID=171875 RepID=UPI0035D78003
MATSSTSGVRTSSTRSAIEEPSNRYYIHHLDSPEQVLVSQLVTDENYISWSRAMLIALFVKNKVGFVDGSIPELPSTDPNLLYSWTQNNNMVICWILNSVSKEISTNKDSVSTYFTKLKTIWEEPSNYHPNCSCRKCSCGGVKNLTDYHNMEYIMSFLMGLDDSFSQVRGQLLFMDLTPPINRVFFLIVQEEQQRKTTHASDSNTQNTPTSAMAFVVKTGVAKSGSQNSQKFHSSYNSSWNQNNIKFHFNHCKRDGHTMERCHKLHGYSSTPKAKTNNYSNTAAHQVSTADDSQGSTSIGSFVQNLNSNQYQQLMSMLSTHLSSSAKVTTAPESSTTNCLAGICFSVSL